MFQIRRYCVLLATGIVVAIAGVSVAQDRLDEGRAQVVKERLAAESGERVAPQPHDIELFGLPPERARKAEFQSLITIASHMYGVTPDELPVVEKIANSMLHERWENPSAGKRFASLVEQRAGLYNKMSDSLAPGLTDEEKLRQLCQEPQFADIQRRIELMDANLSCDFARFAEHFEQTLPEERVYIARKQWHQNAATLPVAEIPSQRLLSQVVSDSYANLQMNRVAAVGGMDEARARRAARAAGLDERLAHREAMRAARQNQRAAQGDAKTVSESEGLVAHTESTGPGIMVTPAGKPVSAGGANPGEKSADKPAEKPVAIAGGAKTPTGQPRPANASPQPPVDQSKGAKPAVAGPAKPVSPPPTRSEPARPLNDWERYVLEFIERYDLSETQKNSAMAILRDMTNRALQIQKSNEDRMKAAEKMTDARAKADRIKELNAPIDGLFDRMKARLDNLLTAAQRAHGEQNKQPARR